MTQDIEKPSNFSQSRRSFVAVAAGALAAGVGAAWWRSQSQQLPPAMTDALWSAEFERPDGSPLKLVDFKNRPLVINFWATWCTPCVEEMPLLNAFFQENTAKNWQVVGLAIDQPSAVKRFLTQYPVGYSIGMAGLNGTTLMTALGNQEGGLPFTLVIDSQGGLLQRKLGKLSDSDIRSWT
jgi:thiol-disulfide isomerase/thioredoxin